MSAVSTRLRGWLERRPVLQRWRSSALRRLLGRGAELCRRHMFLVQFLELLAYRLLLDVLYLKAIQPGYYYDGWERDLRPLTYALSLAALLAFAPPVIRLQEKRECSSSIVTVLNYVYFIPLTSYCGCKWTGLPFFLTALAYWAVLLLLQLRLPVLLPRPASVKSSRRLYALLTVFAVLLVMAVSGRYTGFRFTLNIFDVYGIREESAGYKLPGLVSYALSMAGNILAILLVYWLLRKKYITALLLVVVYLFLFSIGGHKSLFFFLLLVLACYYFYRPWMKRHLAGLAALAALLAILEKAVRRSILIAGLLFRRVMYVPVSLSEDYMSFFRENPLSFFRDGIMGRFSFQDVYSTNIARLIGEANGSYVGANNGLLGDLFANLPVLLGLLLMPLILVICFRLMDAASGRLPEKLTLSSCVYFAISFSNTSWSTVLLSHGFLLTCLLLYIFPKEEALSP